MAQLLEHHQFIWYALAGISLVLELSIMGLSGPLFFFAIASAITGVLVGLGIIDGWAIEVLTVGILSALITLIMWKPLKKLQNSRSKTDESSDMIGLQVTVVDEINHSGGSIRYSGLNWNARLAEEANVEVIGSNQVCIIAAITGTTMLVKPV
jgi:hypothetical protein